MVKLFFQTLIKDWELKVGLYSVVLAENGAIKNL